MRKLICQLQGVVSAQVVLDDKGELAEIHILSESERPPKQVVRDVESAILAKLGVRVDHKKVSVAQVEKKEEGPVLPPTARIELSKVDVSVSGLDCQTTVILSRNGKQSSGVALGHSSKDSLLRLTASATASALKQYLTDSCWLTVEDVISLNLVKREVIVVLVLLVAPRSSVELVGASLVRRSVQEAAASATLDAVNRYITPLISGASESAAEET